MLQTIHHFVDNMTRQISLLSFTENAGMSNLQAELETIRQI